MTASGDGEREGEVVSESYRRRVRLMDRLIAPFDVLFGLELLLIVAGVIGAILFALEAW